MIYRLGWLACMIYVHIRYRVTVEGKENIPKTGFILASNHISDSDPALVATNFYQQIYFMAKIELFQKPFFGWLLRHLGAFPVERGKGDTGAIDWARNVVNKGGVLGMFIEGHRSDDGKPQRPKSGTAMIAGQTKADVLPCAVCAQGKLKFGSKVTVRYGKLIHNSELFSGDGVTPREMKTASHYIMGKIVELLEADA